MYRLKVKVSKRKWKMGIVDYDSFEKAEARMYELRKIGIESIIVKI